MNPVYESIKERSGLEVGMKVQVTTLAGFDARKKSKVFKGEIVSIPSKHFFNVDNGIWRESFCFRDIGRHSGIKVKVMK